MRGKPTDQSLPKETRITALRDNPDALGPVAGWVHRQWGGFSGRTEAQTHARFAAELEPDAPLLPFTLVALLDQLPAGVLTLREHDSTDFDPGTCPWITNVFVSEPSRGCGIARALCIHAESVARDQGYTTLFLASEHGPESLYADIGYRVYNVFRDRRATQHLMRKSIT